MSPWIPFCQLQTPEDFLVWIADFLRRTVFLVCKCKKTAVFGKSSFKKISVNVILALFSHKVYQIESEVRKLFLCNCLPFFSANLIARFSHRLMMDGVSWLTAWCPVPSFTYLQFKQLNVWEDYFFVFIFVSSIDWFAYLLSLLKFRYMFTYLCSQVHNYNRICFLHFLICFSD